MFTPTRTKKDPLTIVFGLILTALVLVPLFPFQEEEAYPFPEDPLKGSHLFVTKGCIKCHAIWGIGDSLGPDLAQMSKDKSLLQLAGLLWSHSPKMIEIMNERGVARPAFTPQEMGDLMGYIYYFNYFDLPGSFIDGERLFGEKGCIICHSVGESPGKDKIPLDIYGRYLAPTFLATGLWNHSPKILLEMRRRGLKQPEFKGQDLNKLLAYLRGQSINKDGEIIYAEPGSPKKGKELFSQKKCNVCHSVWGEGGKRGSDLGKRELRLSMTEMAGTIWSHSGQMWQEMQRIGLPLPVFSANEMSDLISYLYFIQFYEERGDIKEGKKLYREKACIFCHALEGEGENIGPDLSEEEAKFSPIFLASAMWNHAVIMEDMLEEKNLSWPRFSGNEMRDLVSYVRSASKVTRKDKMATGTAPSQPKVLFLSEEKFDLNLAKTGEQIYATKACNACHSIKEKKQAMGGSLVNITKKRDLEWLFKFIKDPKSMFKTDGLAKQILQEYDNIPMPGQGLSDAEVIALIEYLKAPEKVM